MNLATASLFHLSDRSRLANPLRQGVFAPGRLCIELTDDQGSTWLTTLLSDELRELTSVRLRCPCRCAAKDIEQALVNGRRPL